jgi:preprotein translocase subunit SecA
MTFAFGDGTSTDVNPYGVDYVRAWARGKFGADLSGEHIRGMSLRKVRDELIGYQQKWLHDGKLEEEVDQLIAANSEPAALAKAVNARFMTRITADEIEQAKDGSLSIGSNGDRHSVSLRELLIAQGRAFLRKELTDLEQFVLIQIFDQSWKDHLYAMDMLKAGIGLQAFAEQDPRIAYKKEGFRYFQEMMAGIRDKVTDLIFRARIGKATPQPRSNYRVTEARHEVSSNYGVAENVRETASAVAAETGSNEMSAAANEPQGEGATRVKQIVRENVKVGRNDLCPCGSGKKYKKCCGVNEA